MCKEKCGRLQFIQLCVINQVKYKKRVLIHYLAAGDDF